MLFFGWGRGGCFLLFVREKVCEYASVSVYLCMCVCLSVCVHMCVRVCVCVLYETASSKKITFLLFTTCRQRRQAARHSRPAPMKGGQPLQRQLPPPPLPTRQPHRPTPPPPRPNLPSLTPSPCPQGGGPLPCRATERRHHPTSPGFPTPPPSWPPPMAWFRPPGGT